MKKNKIINFTLVLLMVLSLTPLSLFADEVQNNFVDANDVLLEDDVKEEQQDNLNQEQEDTTNQVVEENEQSKDSLDTNTNNSRDGTQFENGYQFDYGTVEYINNNSRAWRPAHVPGSIYTVLYDDEFPIYVSGNGIGQLEYMGIKKLHDGRPVFCIEPAQWTNGTGSIGTSQIWNSFRPDQRQQITRIVQLGQAKMKTITDERVWNGTYWAIEFSIWRTLGYSITNRSTIPEHISRFNTIMGMSDGLINEAHNYGTIPSFANSTQWMGYNHTNRRWEAHLIDTNGVIGTKFSQLNGWRNGNFSTEIRGNVLYVYKDQAHPYDVDPHGYDLNNGSTGGRMVWEPAPDIG